MSIINDAIRKARKELEIRRRGSSISTSAPRDTVLGEEKNIPATSVEPSSESSEIRWTVVVIVSLIFTASLLGSMLLYRHLSRPEVDYDISATSSRTTSSSLLPSESYPKIAFSDKKVKHIVELNGIVYEPMDKWAIINNKIVREGDRVPDGTLVLIAKDFVKIKRDNDEEMVLNLR